MGKIGIDLCVLTIIVVVEQVIEPDVECSDEGATRNNVAYSTLRVWAWLGLVVYIAMFVGFTIGLCVQALRQSASHVVPSNPSLAC